MRRTLPLISLAFLALTLGACDRNRGTENAGTADTTTDDTTTAPAPPPATSDTTGTTGTDTTGSTDVPGSTGTGDTTGTADTTGADTTNWDEVRTRAEERWKSADTDGDNALSRTETAASMPEVDKNFDKFDGNGDGKISRDEIHNFRMETTTG